MMGLGKGGIPPKMMGHFWYRHVRFLGCSSPTNTGKCPKGKLPLFQQNSSHRIWRCPLFQGDLSVKLPNVAKLKQIQMDKPQKPKLRLLVNHDFPSWKNI